MKCANSSNYYYIDRGYQYTLTQKGVVILFALVSKTKKYGLAPMHI